MSKKNQITLDEIEVRAQWLAYLYRIDKERVVAALQRTQATASYTIMDNFFTYYDWSPSMERALALGRPDTILKIFERADLDAIRDWIEQGEKLLGDIPIDIPSVEETCRWEAESHLLPD